MLKLTDVGAKTVVGITKNANNIDWRRIQIVVRNKLPFNRNEAHLGGRKRHVQEC